MTLSRRLLLGSAAAAAGLGALPRGFVRSAWALPTDRRLVIMILRGGLDGLAAVPPVGDPGYDSLRGRLSLAGEAGLHKLDDTFALNPALTTLARWYGEQRLAVIHAVAAPGNQRSHFEAQNIVETGAAAAHATDSGWLNRALPALGVTDAKQALAVAQTMPLVLTGATPATVWTPQGGGSADAAFLNLVERLYANDPVLARGLADARAVDAAAAAAMDDQGGMAAMSSAGQGYAGQFLRAAKIAGGMLAQDGGARLMVLDAGGWDTHVNQGTGEGQLARRLAGLDSALAAFAEGAAPVWDKTVVIAATEFGRTARPNGNNGTDHGTGAAAFVFGGAVAGGRVIADWPGLREGQLFENRDLAATLDLRAVFKGVLADHAQVARGALDDAIFPGSAGVAPLSGLVRA